MNSELLPNDWKLLPLGEIGSYINGRAFKPTEWEDTGRPIIRIQNLTNSSNIVNYYSKEIDDKFIVQSGDLLISWSATLDAFIYQGEEAVLNQHIFKVIPRVNKKYLYYLIKNQIQNIFAQVHGSGMQHITKGKFENLHVPVAPLNQQIKIVEKIEELFSQLDAARASLVRARANLRRYRQSLLKAAFSGELTRAWREEHKNQLESVGQLLGHIYYEKEHYSKKPKDIKKSYSNFDEDIIEYIDLPKGWKYISFNDVAEFKNGINFTKGQKGQIGSLTIDVLNMYSDNISIDTRNLYRVNKKISKNNLLNNGDILFVRSSVKREGVGFPSLFIESSEPVTYCGFIIRARINKKFFCPEYLTYYFRAETIRNLLVKNSSQVTITNISQSVIGKIQVPLCSISEQKEIVSIISNSLSRINAIEKELVRSETRNKNLKRMILEKAFSGHLV